MKRLLLSALAAVLLASSSARADEGDWEAKINTVKGKVELRHGNDSGAPWTAAEEGTALQNGDTVRTGPDGYAELTLDAHSLVEVQPKSNFTVQSLKRSEGWFGLSLGTILGKIKKLSAGSKMAVRTPSAVAAIRGTELGVFTEGEGAATKVGVFDEGVVEVQSAKSEGTVTLNPNKETEIKSGEAPGDPQNLKFFKFAQVRMKVLRSRQKAFMDRFRNKYKLPKNRKEKRR